MTDLSIQFQNVSFTYERATQPLIRDVSVHFTRGIQQAEKKEMTAQKQRARAKHDFVRLKREVVKRRDAASQAHRKRSKRGLASKYHDTREKMDLVPKRWHISKDRKRKEKYILEMC